jgi:hypothetical protein
VFEAVGQPQPLGEHQVEDVPSLDVATRRGMHHDRTLRVTLPYAHDKRPWTISRGATICSIKCGPLATWYVPWSDAGR